MTITNTEGLSDERLAEIVTDADNFYRPEIKSMATELISRRAANSAGGVEVKALEWGETSYGRPEVTTVAGVYRINSAWSGGWSVCRNNGMPIASEDGRENFPTVEAAKAAAQADFNQRILSAIVASPVSAEVTEQVATAMKSAQTLLFGLGLRSGEE